MGCIPEFFCEVLTGPVFIMHAPAPKSAVAHIVNLSLERNPDFRTILSVSQRQLRFAVSGQGIHVHGAKMRQQQVISSSWRSGSWIEA